MYDYAYFMLLGLYAGLILIDFAVDPTSVGYLVESAEILAPTNSQTTLLTTPARLVSAYQISLSWYSGHLKRTTSVTVRQRLVISMPYYS